MGAEGGGSGPGGRGGGLGNISGEVAGGPFGGAGAGVGQNAGGVGVSGPGEASAAGAGVGQGSPGGNAQPGTLGAVMAGINAAVAASIANAQPPSTTHQGPTADVPARTVGPKRQSVEKPPTVALKPVGANTTTGQGATNKQTSGRKRAASPTILTLGLANTTGKTLLGL